MRKKNEKSGLNHFVKYLRNEKVIEREEIVANLQAERISREVIGKFGDYLYRNVESRDAALTYLSKVRSFLCSSYEGASELLSRDKWYTGLRSNMKKQYLRRCVEENKPLKKKQASMSDYDHQYITRKLMYMNTVESTIQRAFMNLSWVLLGRVDEISTCGLLIPLLLLISNNK